MIGKLWLANKCMVADLCHCDFPSFGMTGLPIKKTKLNNEIMSHVKTEFRGRNNEIASREI